MFLNIWLFNIIILSVICKLIWWCKICQLQVAIAGNNAKKTTVDRTRQDSKITSGTIKWPPCPMRTIKILIKTETQINNHQDSTTRPRITRITGKITIKSNKFLSPAPMCLSQWVATREDTTMGIKMDTITRMVMDSVHTTVSDYFFYIFNGLIILFWLIFFYILLCFFYRYSQWQPTIPQQQFKRE